jgi:hypothetical protein
VKFKDGSEEEFYRAWNERKVRRVSDGKIMEPIKLQNEFEQPPESWAQSAQVIGIPQREWIGLTDEEINDLIQKWAGELVFEVTQALKEKNSA